MHARTQFATVAAGLVLTAGVGGVLAAAASGAPAPSSSAPPAPVATTPATAPSTADSAAPSPSATSATDPRIEVPAGRAVTSSATDSTPYGSLALIAVGTVLAGGGAVVAIRRRA